MEFDGFYKVISAWPIGAWPKQIVSIKGGNQNKSMKDQSLPKKDISAIKDNLKELWTGLGGNPNGLFSIFDVAGFDYVRNHDLVTDFELRCHKNKSKTDIECDVKLDSTKSISPNYTLIFGNRFAAINYCVMFLTKDSKDIVLDDDTPVEIMPKINTKKFNTVPHLDLD